MTDKIDNTSAQPVPDDAGQSDRRDFFRRFLRHPRAHPAAALAISAAATLPQFMDQPVALIENRPPPKGLSEELCATFQLSHAQDVLRMHASRKWIHGKNVTVGPLNVVRVRAGECERAFQCVVEGLDSKTGARIYAFREVAADSPDQPGKELKPISGEMKIMMPGRSDFHATQPEKRVMLEMLEQGERSRQIEYVDAFFHDQLLPYLKKHPGVRANLFAHSAGASNGICLKSRFYNELGQCPPLLLFEPFAATHEAKYVVEDLKKKGDSRRPEEILAQLAADTTDIRSNPTTIIAKLPVPSNKLFGDKAYVLDCTLLPKWQDPAFLGKAAGAATGGVTGMSMWRSKGARRPVSRRAVLVSAPFVAPLLTEAAGFASDALEQPYHRLEVPIEVLEAYGDAAVKPLSAKALATPQEILHPIATLTIGQHSLEFLADKVTESLSARPFPK